MAGRDARGVGPRRRGVVLISLCVLLSGALACGTVPSEEVRGDAAEHPGDREAARRVAFALNDFGIDIEQNLAARGGNVVVASFPLGMALAMAHTGADGPTREDLARALHLPPDVDLDAGIAVLRRQAASRSGGRRSETREGTVEVFLPAALWVQDQLAINEPFLDQLAASYGTGVRLVDFRSDPEAARQSVNAWNDEATGGRISELVTRGVFKQYTRFVLTSAAAIEAPWLVRFDPALTRPTAFHRADGTDVGAPTMYLRAEAGLAHAEGDGWQAVELPFVGAELALLVVVPDRGTFATFEAGFGAETLDAITASLRESPLDLALPQFEFATDVSLEPALTELGAGSMFDLGQADFSRITTDEALTVSEVLSETYIGVDEEGLAGGGVTVVPREMPRFAAPTVRIDRPFLFFVRDRSTGLVLQLGRVVDPTT